MIEASVASWEIHRTSIAWIATLEFSTNPEEGERETLRIQTIIESREGFGETVRRLHFGCQEFYAGTMGVLSLFEVLAEERRK